MSKSLQSHDDDQKSVRKRPKQLDIHEEEKPEEQVEHSRARRGSIPPEAEGDDNNHRTEQFVGSPKFCTSPMYPNFAGTRYSPFGEPIRRFSFMHGG